MKNKNFLILCLAVICIFLSGCETIGIPFMLANGLIDVMGNALQTALNLASQMPTPPPGVFF